MFPPIDSLSLNDNQMATKYNNLIMVVYYNFKGNITRTWQIRQNIAKH